MLGKRLKNNGLVYCIIITLIVMVLFPSIIAMNYFADRFRIYHNNAKLITSNHTVNERALKFYSYAKNCQKFNAIIFGNSRSPLYNTELIRELYDLNAFNFGASAESLHGTLRKLQWAIDNKCPLKTIFLPLNADELSYMIDYSLPPYTLRRMDPPELVDTPGYAQTFNRIYLISTSVTLANLKYLFMERKKKTRLRYWTETGDTDYLWNDEFDISSCPKKLLIKEESLIPQTIHLLKKIFRMASKTGIKIVLIWNPITIEKQLSSTQILTVLKGIRTEFPYIQRIPLRDRRLYNSRYYHDVWHFNSTLARQVLNKKNKVPMTKLIEELTLFHASCGNLQIHQ